MTNKQVIFVSHATADVAVAREFTAEIERRGFGVWIAERDVPVGSNYAEEIVTAIEGCAGFLLLLSRASVESRHVRRELNLALDAGRIIIPVAASDDLSVPEDLPKDFRYWLGLVQVIPFSMVSSASAKVTERLAPRDPELTRAADEVGGRQRTVVEGERTHSVTVAPPLASPPHDEHRVSTSSVQAPGWMIERADRARAEVIQAAAAGSSFDVVLRRLRRAGLSEQDGRQLVLELRQSGLLVFDDELTSTTRIRLS